MKEIILIKYDLLHLEILLLTIKTYLLNITFDFNIGIAGTFHYTNSAIH